MKKNKKNKKESKIKNFLKNNKFSLIAFFILWLYTSFVFCMQSIYYDIEMTLFFVIFLIVFAAVFSVIMIRIFSKFNGFDEGDYASSRKKTVLLCIFVFIGTLLFYTLYYFAQYPGGLVDDTIKQLTQVYTGEYNNWHPALQTILFLTIPIKLGASYQHIVYLELIYFALSFTYLIYTLYKNKCPKALMWVVCIYIWVNPYLATYLMIPWKDTAMTIFAVLLFGFYIQIICSKGEWLRNKINIILFALVVVLCTCMRHNAILFTAPITILALFIAPKKAKIKRILIIAIVILLLSVKILYVCLNVEAPSLRTLETSGLPATIWANVMKKNPEALPEETQELMYSISTEYAYLVIYQTGDFNTLKWNDEYNIKVIERLSYSEILYYTWQCFKYAPKESIEAFSKLTALVWGIDTGDEPPFIYILENDYDIVSSPNPTAQLIFTQIKTFFSNGILDVIFGSYGFMNLLMLIGGVALLVKKRVAILHLIPMFCYNFGTMLLLSSWDKRFFLFTIVLWIPTLFLMYKDKTEWNELKFKKRKIKDKN